ncbi:MAG: hypothetical protein E6K17_07220 [Methanobacteriota archaeon]|nr:MAG: hypothetical protein E6K17_07220 [Euryarchaeota archaeon]
MPPELTFGLDLGELAVLEYCLGSGAGWAVVDDLAARIVAERLGVPYIGTARFIKHLGDVGLLAPTFASILIEKLPERGFFIDEEVIEAVLRAPRLSNQNSSDSGGNQTALRPNR